MKFASRLVCGIALIAFMMSAAMAGEVRVVSSIDSAGYTYVEVKQDGKNLWLAADQIKLKPGDLIRFVEGDLMTSFHSSSLERDFPTMLFVSAVVVIVEK